MNEQFLRDFFNMPGAPKPISLRAYIATAALQGMLCNGFMPYMPNGKHVDPFNFPLRAVQLADALIAELAKERT